MRTFKVVKNMPTRVPVIGTLVWYLCLDKWQVSDTIWGNILLPFFNHLGICNYCYLS